MLSLKDLKIGSAPLFTVDKALEPIISLQTVTHFSHTIQRPGS